MKYLLCMVCFLVVQGCVLVPAMDSINKIGITKADRHKLLVKRMREYHDALFWKKKGMLQEYYTADAAQDLLALDKNFIDNEKLVESKVDSIDYSEDSHSAEVAIMIKSYRIPYYVVNDRVEKERWIFNYSTGWQLSEKNTGH